MQKFRLLVIVVLLLPAVASAMIYDDGASHDIASAAADTASGFETTDGWLVDNGMIGAPFSGAKVLLVSGIQDALTNVVAGLEVVEVPALSDWGLLLAVLALLSAGFVFAQRT